MKTRRTIKGTSVEGVIEEAYTPSNPPPYPVTSVAGRRGAVTLSKSDVGLSNVDNTPDKNKPVSTAQATAIAEAKQVGTNAQNAINTHAAQADNPHNVTAAQVGAYVKPASGIPESDLSAEVQDKLNSSGAAENLLQSSVTANRQAGVTEGDMVNLGYALGLEEGKMYTVKYKFNGADIVATAKYEAAMEGILTGATLALCQGVSYEGETMVMPMFLGVQDYNVSLEDYSNAVANYGFLTIVDKHQIIGDDIYTPDENNSSAYVRALQSANAQNAVSVEISAIEPFAEVVADKVKNALKINVNGTAYNYDGSVETEINIETGGGGGEVPAANLLQSSVTANRQAGVTQGDMVNLGYALGLEEGKMYTVKYKFNGADIVATAKYGQAIESNFPCLLQSVTYEGETMSFPLIPGVSSYESTYEEAANALANYGMLYIVDKHQIVGDMEYSADANNASVYTRALQSSQAQNAVSVEITAIEPFAEVAEVVADRVKNALTIGNVVFDGSAAKTVDLSEYAKKDELPATDIDSTLVSIKPYKWGSKTWTGTTLDGTDYLSSGGVWTDGENIYCRSMGRDFVLSDREASTWEEITITGYDYNTRTSIWTDGENIYSSGGSSNHYVFDRENLTWKPKTWNGFTNFTGAFIWTDGTNIYYSKETNHYVLNRSTSTWEAKTWNGLADFEDDFDPGKIWTDGTNIYYSAYSSSGVVSGGVSQDYNDQFVLNRATSTWEPKTWNGLTGLNGSDIWTDGADIYYSSDEKQYVFNRSTSTWEPKTWEGLTEFSGSDLWTDGENIYYSVPAYEGHYVLKRVIGSTTSRLNENVAVDLSEYAKTTGTYSDMTVGNAEKLNGKAASEYALAADLTAHETNISNPHSVSKEQVGLGNVDNIKQYSSQNPPPYPVTSVAGRTGAVTLTKNDVGLGNVDNTSDENKPVSIATQMALNGKANTSGSYPNMTVGNATNLNDKAASEYALKSDIKPRIYSTKKSVYPYKWEEKSWNGFTSFSSSAIWTDGNDIYYSYGAAQYVLNRETSTWESKTWSGLNDFEGRYTWTDGENIYWSYDSYHYVLNRGTSTWETKSWNGLTWFDGRYIWTDGEDIYYSLNAAQYVLNRETSTWESKTWNGVTSFNGNDIWTDGNDICRKGITNHYVLNRETSTWEIKTWNGFTSFGGANIWTDGNDIYYSKDADQYVLNRETSTWEPKTWNGLASFRGDDIWTDGNDIYYSRGESQYKLTKALPTIRTTLLR